jgi:hypothetical protein
VVGPRGLHNDQEKMRWMKEYAGENVIPAGIYCCDFINDKATGMMVLGSSGIK